MNVSAKGFGQPDIVQQVANALQETGLDAHSLRLEITESAAMADAERTRAILIELKALGVRLSLDDFGTGYSSLSYLQRFPVDTLKIDRSFVTGMDQNDGCREIIRTILNLARTLGLDVIAEGTETAAQVGTRCVIVDLAFPGLDLPDLIRRLGEVCASPPRVVAYGSHVDTQTLRAAREAGCDVVLPRSKFVEDLPRELPAWLAGPE